MEGLNKECLCWHLGLGIGYLIYSSMGCTSFGSAVKPLLPTSYEILSAA